MVVRFFFHLLVVEKSVIKTELVCVCNRLLYVQWLVWAKLYFLFLFERFLLVNADLLNNIVSSLLNTCSEKWGERLL